MPRKSYTQGVRFLHLLASSLFIRYCDIMSLKNLKIFYDHIIAILPQNANETVQFLKNVPN